MRQVRRLDHDDAALLADGAQRRLQQPHFAYAGLLQQEFDEGGGGPAAIGQFPVQRLVAGRGDSGLVGTHLVGPPDGMGNIPVDSRSDRGSRHGA
jgi:hypothetical protein